MHPCSYRARYIVHHVCTMCAPCVHHVCSICAGGILSGFSRGCILSGFSGGIFLVSPPTSPPFVDAWDSISWSGQHPGFFQSGTAVFQSGLKGGGLVYSFILLDDEFFLGHRWGPRGGGPPPVSQKKLVIENKKRIKQPAPRSGGGAAAKARKVPFKKKTSYLERSAGISFQRPLNSDAHCI